MVVFVWVLLCICVCVMCDLVLLGMLCDKVVVMIVCLFDMMFVWIGNVEYVCENGLYGLMMLCKCYLKIQFGQVWLCFIGKSGIEYDVMVDDVWVVWIVWCCVELFGYELFQYVDDDGVCYLVGLFDVNDYLCEVGGVDFIVKDYWMWVGSVYVFGLLWCVEYCGVMYVCKQIVEMVCVVVDLLCNMLVVCWCCYIYLVVFDVFELGVFVMLVVWCLLCGLCVDEVVFVVLLVFVSWCVVR